MKTDHFLSHEDYARVPAESRIVVNTQTKVKERIQLKGRVAQKLACGSFLLEQRNPESERFLADIGCEMWDDVDDLIAKIRYWLSHDQERELLASKRRQLYLDRYSPEAWTWTLLDLAERGAVTGQDEPFADRDCYQCGGPPCNAPRQGDEERTK